MESFNVTFTLHAGDDMKKTVTLACKDVLSKSKYFRAKFSKTWCSQSPISEYQIPCTEKSFPCYIKCLEFMGSEKAICLEDVGEVVCTLEAACEWRIEDLIQQCMKYLESMPWRNEDEYIIKEALDRLQLTPSPELSMRYFDSFCSSDKDHMKLLKDAFYESFQSALEKLKVEGTSNLKERIRDFFTCNSLDVINFPEEVTKCLVIMSARPDTWDFIAEIIIFSKQWDMGLYSSIIQGFLTDVKFMKADFRVILKDPSCRPQPLSSEILKGIGKGVIFISSRVRSSFVEKCVSSFLAVAALPYYNGNKDTVSSFIDLLNGASDTLNSEDQYKIWNLWKAQFTSNRFQELSRQPYYSLFASFPVKINEWWFGKVKNSYYKGKHHLESPSSFSTDEFTD